MVGVPVIGRLSLLEYVALFVGFLVLAFEVLLRIVVSLLPKAVITWFYDRSRALFHFFAGEPDLTSKDRILARKIAKASDFGELCSLFGYTHEEHVVLTKDGFLLGLHRLPSKRGQKKRRPGTSTGKPVVYLHHGLLMNSEVWVCLTDVERCLPFVLAEKGFDVWLGNNRGNKYSKKSLHHDPSSKAFWNFSIDDFAWHDIPDSIQYILDNTKAPAISYVGFSQGTAQAFAALSIHPQLNEKVNVFIALAPAMRPPGLAAPLVDGLMKASPMLMFLLFGRRSILSSVVGWKSILYAPIFSNVIDMSMDFLFGWNNANISTSQKLGAFAHLYSYSSTKAVVHWFQIMRTAAFIMYDDHGISPFGSSATAYRPVRFPTQNIVTPIVILYGEKDSLVDIDVLLKELPEHTVAKGLENYEHLDLLWGKEVHIDVIPLVLDALDEHSIAPANPCRMENS